MFVKSPTGRAALAIFIAFGLMAAGLMAADAALAAEKSFPVMSGEELVKMVEEDGKGRVVILSVFASWCPPCKKEMPMLVKARADNPEKDLVLIGLSVDESVSDLSDFVDEQQVNFPVYLGSGELFYSLGIGAIPHTFIFNRKGELVKSIEGLISERMFKAILTGLLSESVAQ